VITLVLGGARSGKSELAEQIARQESTSPVTYVATMHTGGDAELEHRVAVHQARRDPTWTTVDAGDDLPGLLRSLGGTVLVDSLGPWVASRSHLEHPPDRDANGDANGDAGADADALCAALTGRVGDSVVVSDEVGLSVHPSSTEGQRFRDALGIVNRALSVVADRAYLVVAGRALILPEPALLDAPTGVSVTDGLRRAADVHLGHGDRA
jgi:adenosyl cobinamide kinase/adenosyl cobinamide phosphate guanylyltransferase